MNVEEIKQQIAEIEAEQKERTREIAILELRKIWRETGSMWTMMLPAWIRSLFTLEELSEMQLGLFPRA